MAFWMLHDPALVDRSLQTLTAGFAITVVLSALVGAGVGMQAFGAEVAARTSPNMLDLGIALVAGAAAVYAKIRSRAVSSLVVTQPLLSRRLWRSQMGLVSLIFTAVLLLPLSNSFLQLVGITIDWTSKPPLIRASVRVSQANLPTPAQMAAVQNFINWQQPLSYQLVVQRSAIDIIGPDPKSSSGILHPSRDDGKL
jgi:hypothetical protein